MRVATNIQFCSKSLGVERLKQSYLHIGLAILFLPVQYGVRYNPVNVGVNNASLILWPLASTPAKWALGN